MPTTALLQKPPNCRSLIDPIDDPLEESRNRVIGRISARLATGESVNCQWICRFTDYSSANGALSRSKCLTRAVFLQRYLAQIVHSTCGVEITRRR